MDTLDTTDPVTTTDPLPATTPVTESPYDRPYAASTTTEERRVTNPEPAGSFSFAAGFLGWCVAAFLTLALMGIVLGIIGTAAYHSSIVVGNTVIISQTALNDLTVAGTIGALIAIFVGYFAGGYAAGRIDRWHGVGQGLMVVGWTLAAGIVAAVAGRAAANAAANTNVGFYLAPYNIDWGALTTGSIVSLVITLLVMIAGACLGGLAGERWLRRDVTFEETRRVGTWRGRRV